MLKHKVAAESIYQQPERKKMDLTKRAGQTDNTVTHAMPVERRLRYDIWNTSRTAVKLWSAEAWLLEIV